MAEKQIKSLPVVIVKTGTMTREEIERAEKTGFICIIESDEPESVRFLDVPTQLASLDEQARASIELMRFIIHGSREHHVKGDLVQFFVQALIGPHRPEKVAPVMQVGKIKK